VHQSSYHCHTCYRCVEDFDHHCKFLNNCIGRVNYSNFIRLLITVSFYCVLNIGQGIWVFVLAVQDDQYNNEIISRWGTLVCIIVTFLILIPVASLLFFHFYIVCCLETSTI
jgi:palmitoyltransferase